MRLTILVEAAVSVLEALIVKQTYLQELVTGSWVHLSCKDPVSGEIYIYEPAKGFVQWLPASIEKLAKDFKDRYQVTPSAPKIVQERNQVCA